MTLSDFNNALCYIDTGLVDEFIIQKEKLRKRKLRTQAFMKYAPIAACICIVFVATALLLPKLAKEPNTPNNQFGVGVTPNTTASQLDNESEEDSFSESTEESTTAENNDTNSTTILQSGFSPQVNGTAEYNPFQCAYKSDKTIFDINDVTLDFYYGGVFFGEIEAMREQVFNYPSFDLYFSNDQGNKYLIRHVDENLVSEKYKIDRIFNDEMTNFELDFHHFETITIPAELFTKESGVIGFSIYSKDTVQQDSQYSSIAVSARVNYKVVENKVILSSVEYEFK